MVGELKGMHVGMQMSGDELEYAIRLHVFTAAGDDELARADLAAC